MMEVKNFILAGLMMFESEVFKRMRLERCIYSKFLDGTGTRLE